MTCYRYQVGGSLGSNAISYVERACDSELYQALKSGEFCYILNSRQMGKSSLLVKTCHRLRQEDYKCTVVDLTNIGSENITPLQWYKGLVTDLLSGFNLSKKINLKVWWQEQEEISLLQKLSRFISEVLLVEFKENIIIFIDEIDSILALDFPVDDFFTLIRFCYNQRAVNPEYNRLTFAIFGVAKPSDLVQNKQRTPFNIGKSIQLGGLTLDKIKPLADGLIIPQYNCQEIMSQILLWTNGQPFLTHKLCDLLFNLCQQINFDKNELFLDNSVEYLVKKIVKNYIIEKWEFQDEPQHLRTIADRILRNEHVAARHLELYQRILLGEEVLIDESREQVELLLSGLVINSQGKLKVKNLIYEAVFNLEWITRQMENLRPYAQKFKAWIASGQKASEYLLQGEMLEQALAWSYNKRLSDQDYRFLTASQEAAKRAIEKDLASEKQARYIEREKAQFVLETNRLAQQILAQARKTAKKNVQTLRIGRRWIFSITLIVTIAVIILRFSGILEGMELTTLDKFFQARPVAKVDSRILIVAIDESNIQQFGQYPMPDKVLAQALQTLRNYNPKAIGLDLYRDLPAPPGSEELIQIYRTTPNLIGVRKAIDNQIAPPPVLAELEQVGLADQMVDGDGKVRRALLSIRENDKITLGLGLKLAFRYLQANGIPSNNLPDDKIKIGKTLLSPIKPNYGGYVRADAGGYQILLNFHGTQKQFQTVSIQEVLKNRVSPDLIRDRIVLIGATAESVNDLFHTPYSDSSYDNPKKMPGVVVHANITSSILSAALDGRPILKVWSRQVECLWILLWSGIGTLISWCLKPFKNIIVFIMLTLGVLTLTTYLAFLLGWWIPTIPPIIALVVASVTQLITTAKRSEIIQLNQIVESLITFTNSQPIAGQIAIEYLKQSESQENQIRIDKILQNNDF
ncbi:putative Chase2 sensor protein [Calothrix sp. NIES-4071]|nr:putative Chase2 sensor protein [Calothrix sp. NIES-4071]BAZ55796.1 putative Chase2 sensor protein [Calothrix sp. NIES-4105]